MGVQRNGCKTAHTSRYGTQKGANYNLSNLGVFQTFEYQASRFYVQGFDHHHHHCHKAGDEDGVAQGVNKYFKHKLNLFQVAGYEKVYYWP